jgi:hypothetical protein
MAGAYIYSPLQFDDGSIFTFRQWYNQNGQPLLNLNRYSYSTPVLVHTGSLTGPVAGKAFLELPSQLTATFPSIS